MAQPVRAQQTYNRAPAASRVQAYGQQQKGASSAVPSARVVSRMPKGARLTPSGDLGKLRSDEAAKLAPRSWIGRARNPL